MQDQKRINDYVQHVDPIKRAVTDSPRLASSWLKGSESLTPFQRLGYGLVSIAYLGGFAFSASGAKENLDSMDGSIFMGLCFSAAGLFFLLFGTIGLRMSLGSKLSER